jgi:hypothetical protein
MENSYKILFGNHSENKCHLGDLGVEEESYYNESQSIRL